jgi:hypothetical protein
MAMNLFYESTESLPARIETLVDDSETESMLIQRGAPSANRDFILAASPSLLFS